MKFLLFTGKHCKSCPVMKLNMAKAEIEYDEISTDSDNGKMMAGIFRISGVPSLAIAAGDRPAYTFPSGLLPVEKLIEIKNKYGVK